MRGIVIIEGPGDVNSTVAFVLCGLCCLAACGCAVWLLRRMMR